MYSNGDDDTHMGYIHMIAITNFYHIQKVRYQLLIDYRDHFVAYRKVCVQLGIKVGASESGGTNMLKSSDEEIEDKQYEKEEENVSMTSEEYQPLNQDKNDSTALDDSKESDY